MFIVDYFFRSAGSLGTTGDMAREPLPSSDILCIPCPAAQPIIQHSHTTAKTPARNWASLPPGSDCGESPVPAREVEWRTPTCSCEGCQTCMLRCVPRVTLGPLSAAPNDLGAISIKVVLLPGSECSLPVRVDRSWVKASGILFPHSMDVE